MTPPSIVNSGGTLTEAQQAALAAKEEELNDLKNTLQSLKQLYAQTKSTVSS